MGVEHVAVWQCPIPPTSSSQSATPIDCRSSPLPSRSKGSAMKQVAGIDGCREGWVVVRRAIDGGVPEVEIVASFELVVRDPLLEVIAIDVPIGLLDGAQPGGRPCDVAARRMLRPNRGSSVFSAPVRAVLGVGGFGEAAARSRASSPHQLALSQQCFAIVPKIAEVDGLVTPAVQGRVVEVHPECSFAVMNGGEALVEGKKSRTGRAARLALLTEHWAPGVDLVEIVERWRGKGVSRDDVVDAMVACWSAERVRAGVARRLPEAVVVDGRGLRMEIWV